MGRTGASRRKRQPSLIGNGADGQGRIINLTPPHTEGQTASPRVNGGGDAPDVKPAEGSTILDYSTQESSSSVLAGEGGAKHYLDGERRIFFRRKKRKDQAESR